MKRTTYLELEMLSYLLFYLFTFIMLLYTIIKNTGLPVTTKSGDRERSLRLQPYKALFYLGVGRGYKAARGIISRDITEKSEPVTSEANIIN